MKMDFKVAVKAPFVARPQRGKSKSEKRTAARSPSRAPRLTVLMAMAIHMEQLLRDGIVNDQAELANLAGVSRARVTQAMNLLWLDPAIQEKLLFSNTADVQRKLHAERTLRDVTRHSSWMMQRLLVNRGG